MITPETRAEIQRLVRVEHLSITKAARTLGIHHSTVRHALDSEGRIPTIVRAKKSMLDPFAALIQQKLDEYPNLTATTLCRMLKDRGYTGSAQTVRHRVMLLRGSRVKKAYMPVTVFAGDEGQVDWAHFGTMVVGRTKRKLSCFIMVLSYSRRIYAKFFFDQTLDSFLSGHVGAFNYFGGVPRQLRYDNLKAAVAERYGQSIRFNPQLLEMAGYYAFKPSACNPYSGHEKGRVERAVRYVRESFFVGKDYMTIDKVNSALALWLTEVSDARTWADDRRRTVKEIFDEEKPRLISLPAEEFSVRQERPVRSGKIPFIRFDKNDYSIPFKLVGQPLSVSADESHVLISRGSEILARHKRSYSGGEKIVMQEHFSGLNTTRPGGETVAARCLFTEILPNASKLFSLMAERGVGLGPATAKLFELLSTYGKDVMSAAIDQALTRRYAEVSYVAQIADQMMRQKKGPVVNLPVNLPAHMPGVDIHVTPHDAATYDDLTKE